MYTWTGKLYSCGGYGQQEAGLMMVDTATWQAAAVESCGEAPTSHDSHSVTTHGEPLLHHRLLSKAVNPVRWH